ncbi:hypothetical protein J2858_001600 [Neorhizobium galegae]|uniref:DUF2793 domain-containing protein n=1 Tax=Neorhizobium galegae TaxID=399 RepID=UPI001AE9CA79|nr:DUF2793 domain-containing protein [Neorhizobium galegae]MBP2548684.1 hypothetical protein [Neorhizobium galegae]
MADTTPNLRLPYILPSQAQKHVTHNEALLRLDTLVQLAIDYEGAAPPASPVEGSHYAVTGTATGAWAGHAGTIATFQDGAWSFLQPNTGFLAWFKSLSAIRAFSGTAWVTPGLPDILTPSRLGISATPDDSNRLSISSAASLFNNAGAGHQLMINKAAVSDTASLLFQSGWSGRAEMGLAGNDQFAVKVSADGGSWKTGMSFDGAGRPSFPNRPLARAHRATGTSSPASGASTGFTTLALEQGGVTLGAAVSGGGNALVVPASGIYKLTMMVSVTSSSGHTASLRRNASTTLLSLSLPSAAPLTVCASTLASLTLGDTLTFLHAGTAVLDEGAGRTELSLQMI